jgi:bifunctional non-homologous end joining protein LigD
MARSERGGKVFIDWSQNAEHKTTVSAYSVRAKREQPFVSMPISWTELESALAKRDIQALMFEPRRAVERVRKVGDLFAPVLSLEQTIPQDILKQMKLPVPQSPKPVLLPATSAAPHSLPRSSGQGGRKLFVLHRAGTDFELALEVNGLFQAMRLVKFPTKKGAKSDARAVGERDLSSVTEESASSGIVWDLGTYEVVEGSYKKGALEVYLSGRKLDGEWSLKKVDGSTWQVGNITGRLKRGLPSASSALAGMETSAPKSGRRRDAR